MIIGFLFCWNIYRVSDWTFKRKQGWETHTKGLSQILPNKSRWIFPFLRSQKFLEILYPLENLPNSFDKLTGNLRTSNFWRSQIENIIVLFITFNFTKVLSQLVWEEDFPYSLKTWFKPVIFQIETIKFVSIFTGSFSPFVNFCEVIRFSIKIPGHMRMLKTPYNF